MMASPKSSGFTIVELVMVIILIGIVSALGIGLFARSSVFSPLLATQQLASATLRAQQAALAGNGANVLEIDQSTGDFTFTVGASLPVNDSRRRTFSIDRESAVLSVAGGLPLTLTFNPTGAVSSGSSYLLTFSGESSFQTCISSLGAVYPAVSPGACQL